MGCSQSISRPHHHAVNGNNSSNLPHPANDVETVHSLLQQSAFFSRLSDADLQSLSHLAKPGHDRQTQKIPLPKSEKHILLGGVQLNWDFVANQTGLVTMRYDCVGEESLLRVPKSSSTKRNNSQSGDEQANKSSHSSESSTYEDSTHARSQRDDFEYIICERVESEPDAAWYVIESAEIFRLAQQSKAFNSLIHDTLQTRARFRYHRFGLLNYLTDSEFHYLAQALDYFKLSALAKQDSGDEPVFAIICDGTLQVSFAPRISSPSKKAPVKKKRSSSSTSPPMPRRSRILAEPNVPSIKLGPCSVLGENTVLLDCAHTTQSLHVIEDGVALGMRASHWSMFLQHVASEKTQKLLIAEAELRSSLANVRTLYPCFRKCSKKHLRIIVDAIQAEHCSFSDKLLMDPENMYLVRHGAIQIIPPSAANAELSADERRPSPPPVAATAAKRIKRGGVFGFDSALNMYRSQLRNTHSNPIAAPAADNGAAVRNNTSPAAFFVAVDSWNENPNSMAAAASRRSMDEHAADGIPNTSSSTAGPRTTSSRAGGGACFWKIPSRVLANVFLEDPIFAADLEFMTSPGTSPFLQASSSATVTTAATTSSSTSASSSSAVLDKVPLSKTASSTSLPRRGTIQQVQVSPVSFLAILNHPIALSHFRRYLVSIHAQENLDFYWAVRFFPKKTEHIIRLYKQDWTRKGSNQVKSSDDDEDELHQDDDDQDNRLETPPVLDDSDEDLDDTTTAAADYARTRIADILREFVVDGAPSQINIHSDTHKKLKAMLVDPTSLSQNKSVLDAAYEEVLGILFTDSFPRFVSSQEAFGEMVRSVLAGDTEQMFASPNMSSKPLSPIKTLASGLIRPSTPSLTAGRKFFSSSSTNLGGSFSSSGQLQTGQNLDFGSL